MRKVVDWANLEELPVGLVLDKLEEHIDHVRFAVVCKTWLSVAKLNHQSHQFRSNIPPITIPIRPNLRYLYKVTLSADPITSPNDYVVAAIYGFGRLAFKTANQPFWIRVDKKEFSFNDVVFYKGLLIADQDGEYIVSFKINNPPGGHSYDRKFTYYEKIATAYSVPVQNYMGNTFFVKSFNDDIWKVRKYAIDRDRPASYTLDVYKLELDVQSGKLEQMNKLESLEDNILFVGIGDSISVPASCHSKLEKDSIYFIYDYDMDDLALGVYNMKDGSCQRQSLPISFKWMQPFWVLPQFQWD
ncbi:DUF295 family protein [Medicago truncatula]|uniref:DUF295 family protein n=1 Tax=Medicago truncatula TaxID=3880 RepID=G7L2F2_MEDTR|nr:DUF295 family protein [Medicago truncatula]